MANCILAVVLIWSVSHSVFPVSLQVLVCTVRQNDSTEDRFPSTYTNSYPCGGVNSRAFSTVLRTWVQTARGFFYVGFYTVVSEQVKELTSQLIALQST